MMLSKSVIGVLLGLAACNRAEAPAAESVAPSSVTAQTASTTAPQARGAATVREAIEGFLTAVNANDEAAARALVSERLRGRSADVWAQWWSVWRGYACTPVTIDEAPTADAEGGANSRSTLRCTPREMNTSVRLRRVGGRWFWDEN